MGPKHIDDETCGRCSGKGIIEVFRHVVGGICFRCWGAGIDPKTADQLQAWLKRAREEYRTRKAALKGEKGPWAHPKCTGARLEREMQLIVRLGKRNRARLDKLLAEYELGRDTAKAMASR